jgi:hypothetical protein
MPKPASLAAKNYKEPDFAAIVAKPLSSLQEHFLAWVLDKTGITFATKKEEAAFAEGIRIGVALRGVHQASPENQERLEAARVAAEEAREAEAAAPAPAKATKAAAAPAKAAAAKATKAAKATPAAAPAEEVRPARRPAKKAGGRRPTATATATDDEAPF